MAVNIGPRIGIEGEAEYRKQIQNIIQETKTLKSEMGALAAGFDKDSKSLKANRQHRQLLSDAISSQKAKLTDLKNMQQLSSDKLGASATQTLKWKQAVADATAELKQMEAELKNLPNGLQMIGDKMKDIGGKMKSVGKNMSMYVTGPLAAVGTVGVKKFADVDKTMQLTKATMGATGEEAQLLSDAMKDAAANSTFGMSDAANATLNFARAGLDAEQAASALAPSMNLAAAAGGDLDTVSGGLVATINGFHGSFEEAGTYADVFANACNNSALDIDSLSSSMSVAAPIFASAGYSVQDAALYMGTMANAGIDANTAANSLKTGMARLVSPAKQGAEWMKKLGINVTNADGSMKNSVTVQSELHDAFAGLSESEQIAAASAIFGKNQMSNWLALINTAPEDVSALSLSLEQEGTTAEQAEAMMSGFGGSLEKLKSSVDVATTSLGEALAPVITKVADAIQGAVDWFNSLDSEQQTMIATIGLVVAAIGPVLTITGTLISSIGTISGAVGTFIPFLTGTVAPFLTGTLTPAITGLVTAAVPILAAAGPFIAVGAAIVGAGVLVYKNWDKIKETAGKLKEGVAEKWNSLKQKTSETWENIKKEASEKWDKIKSDVTAKAEAIKKGAAEKWDKMKSDASSKWESIKSTASEKWNGIKETISGAVSKAKENLSSKLSEMKSTFESKGGGIKGAAAAIWEQMKNDANTKFALMNKVTGGKLDEMAKTAKTKMVTVKNNIINGFNGLKEKIKTIGGNLITGLWNGINDKVAWLKNKISGFTTQVLNSIKGFFGIHSPSKETELIGKYLDEGLAAGIAGNEKKVIAAAKNVVDLTLGVYKKSTTYKVKDVLGEQLVAAGKTRVEELKKSNKLTVAEEVDFWTKIVKKTKEGSKAYAQAQKQLTKSKKTLIKSAKKLNKQYIADLKEISDALSSSISDINTKLAENIASEMESAKTETQKVWDDLANSIAQRASSIKFGLFDEVSLDEGVSGTTLLQRLKKQVSALSSYYNEMNKLKARVGDGDLYREVAAQGPKALNQIKALNSLSDSQLSEYQRYYDARASIAEKEATEELSQEREEAKKQVAQIEENSRQKIEALKTAAEEEKAVLIEEAKKQTAELSAQYVTDLKALGVNLTNCGKKAGSNLMQGLLDGIKDIGLNAELDSEIESLTNKLEKLTAGGSTSKNTKGVSGAVKTTGTYNIAAAKNVVSKALAPLAYTQTNRSVSNNVSYGDTTVIVNAAPSQDANEVANVVMKKMSNERNMLLRGAM